MPVTWPGSLLVAEAVEKLFWALKSRLFGNERKLDSNKNNNLGGRQFGNARRFRLKPGFSGVFQQSQPIPGISLSLVMLHYGMIGVRLLWLAAIHAVEVVDSGSPTVSPL